LQAVTAADIQRVAQKYLTDNNRYVIYYLPESERPKTSGNNPSTDTAKGGASR
jgi:predicted Zn-dependent peptidase